MSRWLLLLLMMLFQGTSYAFQSQNLVHLTTEDGLSQNLVFDMVQDHEGFIWIGTKDGLNRYDGYDFKIFRNNPSDSTSLASNYVTFIEEDEDHNLWVETRPGGLHFYDDDKDEFIRMNSIAEEFQQLLKTATFGVVGNQKNGWWIANYEGIYHLSPDKKAIREVPIANRSDLTIGSIQKTEHPDSLYVATIGKGMYKLSLSDSVSTPHHLVNQHLGKQRVEHFFINSDNHWVAVQQNTVFIISRNGELLLKKTVATGLNEISGRFDVFLQNEDGRYLAVKEYGFYEFIPETGTLETIAPLPLVYELLIDDAGIFWIGTSGNGLYKMDPKTARFGLIKKPYPEVMAPGFLMEMKEKNNYSYPDIYTDIFRVIPIQDSIRWVLTRRLGLFESDHNTGTLTKYTTPFPLTTDTTFTSFWMEKDENGNFDILTSYGIMNLDPQSGVQSYVPLDRIFPNFSFVINIPVFEALTVVKKHAGYYWVGSTEYGLSAYNITGDSLRKFIYNQHNPNSISSNHILSITPDPQDPSSYMWVGTDGGGLNRINIETGNVMRFTEQDGLPNNVIYAIYPDSSGFLWMSSNKGIIRMNPENFEILNFNQTDGLQSDEFNRREHHQFEDGRIVFCGTFGCNIFNPNEIELNPSVPPVSFTNVSVMNQSVLPYGSSWFSKNEDLDLNVLNVDWQDNIISFEFAALEFSGPSKNQYKYRFPPFVGEWTEIGTRREISFTNLDPGFYTLEVMGSNNDGIWSEEPARLGVQVLPPFWMTATFRALAIFIFSGFIAWMVWYLSKRKYRQQLRELEYKMAVDRERLRISRDMHDDLGARLTQIRLMSEFATAESSISEKMKSRFQEISAETKDVIQQFSEIVWSLNPKNDTLPGLANYMIQYSENFCRKINIPCRIQADEDFPDLSITSNVRHNLLSVLKEALNNAAKYAQSKEIRVSISLQNQQFIITITDNGNGFDVAKIKSNGQGLSSMKARIEEIGGDWKIESAPKTGTSVTISWPIE